MAPETHAEVDYLVVGAGAAGMAFTDALVAASDATVLMVDRRHGPGGHWNDAYPFVRLHQPSAYYGVDSRDLGADRIDETGPNAGFYERATAAEICHYYQAVLAETLLPTGRVALATMSDALEDGPGRVRVVSRVTGAVREVTVRRKVVDARYQESSIPATHTPGFAVDDGARCVPVNDLVRAADSSGYVVLGGGKTSMDACWWLLDQGVDPAAITWIRPRESWVLDRGSFQPREKVGDFIIGFAAGVEAAATADTIPELFGRLEECRQLERLDRSVEPTMYRAAILSDPELETLRTIEHVVRLGRVRRIGTDRIVLDEGEIPTSPRHLHVDCTADGLPRRPTRPIFEPGRITIQLLRETSACFNAALVGHLEATRDDLDEQNALTPPNTYPDDATDWIRTRHLGMVAQQRWDRDPDLTAWIEASRLNLSRGLGAHAGDPGVGPALVSYLEHSERAIENLARFRAQLGDEVTLPA